MVPSSPIDIPSSPIDIPPAIHISTSSSARMSTWPPNTVAPAVDDYTPPCSPLLATETSTSPTTAKNLQSAKDLPLSKPKSNEKVITLPADVRKSTEPR
jgi:hypothetical protein